MIRYFGKPNEKQDAFLKDTHRYVAYGGARGGGKSWAVRTKAKLLALHYGGIRILIVRRSYRELLNNHIFILERELYGLAKYNKTEKIFFFPNGSSSDLLNQGVSDYTQGKISFLESGYHPSAAVQQAQSYLSSIQESRPGMYESKWSSALDDLYNQIVNRDKFSYDLGTDMLYNQYKDQYQNLGSMAMMDTMGQAAALTGGYGSSYSQSVGQQAYNAYLQQLNDVVPELYSAALNQYNQEGTALYNQYGLLNSREQADYNAYRDSVSDYYNELNYAQNAYNNVYAQDYQQYADQIAYWADKGTDENSAYLTNLAAQQKNTAVKTTSASKSQKKTEEKTETEKKTEILSTSAQQIADRAAKIQDPAQQLEFLKKARSGGTITASEEKKILARLGLS